MSYGVKNFYSVGSLKSSVLDPGFFPDPDQPEIRIRFGKIRIREKTSQNLS